MCREEDGLAFVLMGTGAIAVGCAGLGAFAYGVAALTVAFPVPVALAACGVAARRLWTGNPVLDDGEAVVVGSTAVGVGCLTVGPVISIGVAVVGLSAIEQIDKHNKHKAAAEAIYTQSVAREVAAMLPRLNTPKIKSDSQTKTTSDNHTETTSDNHTETTSDNHTETTSDNHLETTADNHSEVTSDTSNRDEDDGFILI
jgi:hypothetical protein